MNKARHMTVWALLTAMCVAAVGCTDTTMTPEKATALLKGKRLEGSKSRAEIEAVLQANGFTCTGGPRMYCVADLGISGFCREDVSVIENHLYPAGFYIVKGEHCLGHG